MAMLVSMKRPPTAEELLEPLVKRCRLDVCMTGPEDWGLQDQATFASAAAAAAAAAAASPADLVAELDRRRLAPMEDTLQDGEPAFKRLRLFQGLADPAGHHSGAAASGSAGAPGREAGIRRWAEGIVRALHGCPSVEEAAQRCASALAEFEGEVRQNTLQEAEAAAGPDLRPGEEDKAQGLQHTNRVLMRAVHHLAERCRRLEASAAEAQSLRDALDQAQEVQRRLASSNQVLQEHLRIHLNGCHFAA